MLSGNLVLVFAIGAVLAVLTILQFFLAARHDQVVSTSGPLQALQALEEQLANKSAILADIDEDLRKRREALANVANVQAEVDALVRQRDELLTEWNSLEAKREEVRAVRRDLESIVNDLHSTNSDLATANSELEEVRAKLEKAERLVGQIDDLKSEQEDMLARLAELRAEVRKLEDAEARVATLDARAKELESAVARVEGQLSAQEAILEETRSRLSAERQDLAEVQQDRSDAVAELVDAEAGLRRADEEIAALTDRKATLEARLARLEADITAKSGQSGGTEAGDGADGSAPEDRLKELEAVPPVLADLARWTPWRPASETEALHRVSDRLSALGLEYPSRVVQAFHTAMKVNETTQMAVLAGISGTGKSQLPRQYAAGMGIGFLQVPVQPRWDSPQDLMGFYNYIEQRFRPTDMARALWQLDEQNNPDSEFKDSMMMILLDEMNLARVEYYFSDFLSRLESRPSPDHVHDPTQRKDAEIELEIPMPRGMNAPRIFPGYNLLFAGTMNEDESTQSLSDKVVDRANVLRFAAPKSINKGKRIGTAPVTQALSREQWRKWIKPVGLAEREPRVTDAVDRMVELMRSFKRPIGHRLGRAMMAYVANYPEVEGANRIDNALSDQVEMRLLPKLRGVELDGAESEFGELQSFVADALGDPALAQAIGDSVDASEGRGQFVWNGLTR